MKTYLGDSVYVEITDHDLILTTENGHGPSNAIVLEWNTIKTLSDLIENYISEDNKREKRLEQL